MGGGGAAGGALPAEARQRHEDLTTSYIKVRGHPEPRKVPATIPDSFANLAKAAAKDNNKLHSTRL